jgi:hypothetical protein
MLDFSFWFRSWRLNPNECRAWVDLDLCRVKMVLVTGGDSGIGCAVGVHFSAEGATVAFTHVPGIEEKTQSNFSKSTRLLLLMIPSRLLQILDLTTTAKR